MFLKRTFPVKGPLQGKRQRLARILIGSGLVALISVLFPSNIHLLYVDLKVGDISEKEIVAPFDFPILMTPEELKAKQEEARSSVVPVFDLHPAVAQEVPAAWSQLFFFWEKQAQHPNADTVVARLQTRLTGLAGKVLAPLQEQLAHSDRKKDFLATRDLLAAQFKELYADGVMADKTLLPFKDDQSIYLHSDSATTLQAVYSEVADFNESKKKVLFALRSKYPQDPQLVEGWYTVFNYFFKPNVTYNEAETKQLRAEAVAQVPVSSGMIFKGEQVLNAHKRVTAQDIKVLRSLAVIQQEKQHHRNIQLLLPIFGRVLTALGVVLVFALFLVKYRPATYYSLRSLLLLASIVGLVLLLSGAVGFAEWPKYLSPIPLGVLLVTILFDLETAFFTAMVLSLLVGCIQLFDFKIALVSMVAGLAAILSVLNVRHRKEFYRPMLFVPLAYLVSIASIGILNFTPARELLQDIGCGIANGILSTMLTLGILPVCEMLFKTSTDITLLELSDLNHPILKQLALNAPGTYHHSIIVGNLAEAGAESVGANSLLARVGAYFHDIGKLHNPEYFVENQKDFPHNKHDALTPSMSSLILMNHVKNGDELAQKHRLPHSLIDIIGQHHGTTLMSFFYQRALQNKTADTSVAEADYRYPGPRPQTKEAGIVMLADAVEAASRSLKDPTTIRLKEMVNHIIESKFRDTQLDECELTFKDLTHIKENFLVVLTGIFHNRIDYSAQKQALKSVKEPTPPITGVS